MLQGRQDGPKIGHAMRLNARVEPEGFDATPLRRDRREADLVGNAEGECGGVRHGRQGGQSGGQAGTLQDPRAILPNVSETLPCKFRV